MANNIILNFTSNTEGLDEASRKLEELTKREKDLVAEVEKLKQAQAQAMAIAGNNEKARARAMLDYERAIVDSEKELRRFRTEINEVSRAHQNLERSITRGASQQTFRALRRELQEQMRQMQLNGQVGSEAYEKIKRKLTELNVAQQYTSSEIRNMSSSTRTFDTILGGTQALAGGYSALTGTMSLFGEKNQDVQKMMMKLQSIIAITTGLQQIQNATLKQGALMQGLQSIQIKYATIQSYALAKAEAYRRLITMQGTNATIASTVALKAFTLISKASPLLLLASAAMVVVGALVAFVRSSKDATIEQDKLKKRIEDFKSLSEKTASSLASDLVAYKNLQTQWNKLANDLNGKKKFITENKDEFNKLGIEVGNVSDAESFLVKNTDAVVQSLKARAMATAAQELATEKYKESIQKQLEAERKLADAEKMPDRKRLSNTQAFLQGENSVDIENKDKKFLKQEAEKLKQEAEDIKNLGDGIYDMSIQQAEKAIVGINAIGLKAFIQTKEKVNKVKDTLQKYTDELKNEQAKAIADDETREIKTLQNTVSKRLSQIKGNSEVEKQLRIQIEENLKNDILKIRDKYDKQRVNSELQTDVNLSNAKLKTLKEGSDEYISEMENNLRVIAKLETQKIMFSVMSEEERASKLIEINSKLQSDLNKLEHDKSIDGILNKYNREVLLATQQYENGKLSRRKYESELDRITIDSLNKQIESRRKNGEDTIDLEQELSEKRIEIAEQEAEAKKAMQEELFKTISTLANLSFDSQKAKIQQQIEDIDKYYTTDIEKSTLSTNHKLEKLAERYTFEAEKAEENKELMLISEEDYNRRSLAIENESDGKKLISKEEYNRRQTDLKRKQAQVEKEQAIFNLMLTSGQSIARAFADYPFPVSAIIAGLVGVQTLAQLNAVRSQPLPKYWKGRKGGQGEHALVGEYGPEIMWIPNGASIMPAHDSLRAMNGDTSIMSKWNMPFINPSYPVAPAISQQLITDARSSHNTEIDYDKLGRAVAKYQKAPKERPVYVSVDRSATTVTDGNSKTRYLNTTYKGIM